jgi:hypothetical protein
VASREERQYGQGEIAHVRSGTDDRSSPLISPVVSSSEYDSCLEEDDGASERLDDPGSSKEVSLIEGDKNQEGNPNEIGTEPTIIGTETLSLELNVTATTNEPRHSVWDIEINSDTMAAVNLTLVHKLKQERGIVLAFSMDGKYLATASSNGSGIVSIFDPIMGERIRYIPFPSS